MSKIYSMLDTARRSLSTSQTSLETVGHNIANKTTEGFSRQRVELQALAPDISGRLKIGRGARPAQVVRINNPWLEKQLQKEGTNLGFADARADGLSRVEQVYNEQLNKGLNQYFSDFFNAFKELSASPESLASRTMVREAGVALAKDFARVAGDLGTIKEDLDFQASVTIREINEITKEIASLNSKVQMIEVQGIPANDERDRRDLLLKELGEKVDITWAESKDGVVSVTAGRTAVVVSGSGATEIKMGTSRYGERPPVLVSSVGGNLSDFGDKISGGRLGGLLQVREGVIKDLLNHVDKMAFTFAEEVNKAHIEGFDQSGRPGVLFFEMPNEVEGAAAKMKMNQSVINDVRKIAAAAEAGAPGDNTIANIISSLQNKKVMDGGISTLNDYYNAQVGQIGATAQMSVKALDAQKNIVGQLANIRESVSGVSLDEEATKMIEFQKLYDASARLIRTADEMFDTLLKIKPL